MYHVGTNKRSHDSAELIYYGVAICSQDKPLESVTISDVQRVTGIARTTFYRSFDNVLDVLEWKCDQYYQSFLASCPADVIEGLSLRHPVFPPILSCSAGQSRYSCSCANLSISSRILRSRSGTSYAGMSSSR